MRILVLSDLHVEEAAFDAPTFDGDLVVLAGDVANGAASVRWARRTFPAHRIVQIAGNHEFYDGELFDVTGSLRAAAREDGVDFLENDEAVIDGVRFLGCTLWTDFRLFEPAGRPLSKSREEVMVANAALVPDFRVIRIRGAGTTRALAPADSARLHEDSRRWLERSLAAPFAGPTVVVTHHLPSWRSVHPAHARWVTSASFASDLDDLIERPACWIHGHTHVACRYFAGKTQVVCNPRGYPAGALRRMGLRGTGAARISGAAVPDDTTDDGFENTGFDPSLVVEIPSAGRADPLR